MKIGFDSLEGVQGDICGLIHLTYKPFRYFIILVYAFLRWSHMYLLSSCNLKFARCEITCTSNLTNKLLNKSLLPIIITKCSVCVCVYIYIYRILKKLEGGRNRIFLF